MSKLGEAKNQEMGLHALKKIKNLTSKNSKLLSSVFKGRNRRWGSSKEGISCNVKVGETVGGKKKIEKRRDRREQIVENGERMLVVWAAAGAGEARRRRYYCGL